MRFQIIVYRPNVLMLICCKTITKYNTLIWIKYLNESNFEAPNWHYKLTLESSVYIHYKHCILKPINLSIGSLVHNELQERTLCLHILKSGHMSLLTLIEKYRSVIQSGNILVKTSHHLSHLSIYLIFHVQFNGKKAHLFIGNGQTDKQ